MHAKDIKRHELIGITVQIIESDNPYIANLKGKVIDETKNVLKIETANGTKMIIKKQVTLAIRLNNKTVKIDGKALVGKPEDRIKK